LHAAFGEFYRRGLRTVGLGVDAASLTGATRLYEMAGMHVAHEYILFEKILEPGA
jgi:mycothiol synthase